MKKIVESFCLTLKCGFLFRLFLMDTNPHSNISSNDDNNFEKIYSLLRLTQFRIHSQKSSDTFLSFKIPINCHFTIPSLVLKIVLGQPVVTNPHCTWAVSPDQ